MFGKRVAASLFPFLSVWLAASPSAALESAVVDDREADLWSAGATCSVTYWNACTGWLWLWNSWADEQNLWRHGARLGLLVEPCCDETVLTSTQVYCWDGVPVGYGFTGSVFVASADANGCPTTPLASQVYLPLSGAVQHLWDVPVTGPVVLTVELAAINNCWPDRNYTVWPTDQPSAGPTGPQALGLCYPETRVPHSFYYGTATSPLCPGEPPFDGVGTAEWLRWGAQFTCAVGLDHQSWSSVKALYR